MPNDVADHCAVDDMGHHPLAGYDSVDDPVPDWRVARLGRVAGGGEQAEAQQAEETEQGVSKR
jgi:hypothetical protein